MSWIEEYRGDPWDRQIIDGEPESQLWFSRFDRYYRPQGVERNLMQAYRLWRRSVGKPDPTTAPQQWRDAQSNYDWKYRAEAWDENNRQERLRDEEEERRKMRRRHVQLGIGLQSLGGERAKQIQKRPELLSAAEARRYIQQGIQIERQARGLPEYLLSVTKMSDEDLLNRYNKLLEGIEDSGSGDEAEGCGPSGEEE